MAAAANERDSGSDKARGELWVAGAAVAVTVTVSVSADAESWIKFN